MSLLEYIKKNYSNPNVEILRSLDASEVLIEYLLKTSHNTNLSIVPQLIEGSGGEMELIAKVVNGYGVIAWDEDNEEIMREGDITTLIDAIRVKEIVDNHEKYEGFVFFNGEKEFKMSWYEELPNIFEFEVNEEDAAYEYYASVGLQENGSIIQGHCIDVDSGNYVPILIEIYVKRKA